MNLFHNLQLPTDFLRTDPDTWDTQERFLTAHLRLRSLKIVNFEGRQRQWWAGCGFDSDI